MKTEFKLDEVGGGEFSPGTISIGLSGLNQKKPFVSIHINGLDRSIFLKDKELERFAVNILKALKSKKLLQGEKFVSAFKNPKRLKQ